MTVTDAAATTRQQGNESQDEAFYAKYSKKKDGKLADGIFERL